MEPNKVFRQAALDRLASPEQLDKLMRVTDAKGWLALAGGALIVTAAVLWGIFGSMQSKVSASGILLAGGALTEITAQSEGQIISLEVKAGDVVKKGQRIAQLAQPALVQQIDSLKSQIKDMSAGPDGGVFSDFRIERKRRLQGELDRLEKSHRDGVTIVSSMDGRVVEVRSVPGASVQAGTPIVALEQAGERAELEALLYFDSYVGKALKPGMQIELVPSVVRKERFGALIGRVKSVEEFPSTRLGMMGALRNEQLVDTFIQSAGGAPIAVRAQLVTDPNTPSGYKWSSGKGPEVVLTSGTRCSGAAITRTRRPIALIFPALDDGG